MTGVELLPARTDSQWWHDYVLPHGEVRYIRRRMTVNGNLASIWFRALKYPSGGPSADRPAGRKNAATLAFVPSARTVGGAAALQTSFFKARSKGRRNSALIYKRTPFRKT